MGYRDLTREKQEYYIWLNVIPTERIPRTKTAFAKYLKIQKETLHAWDKELKDYTSKEFFLSKKREVDEGILAGIKRGNAQMAKLAKQISEELVEKTEVTHKGFTADDIDKINKKADAELKEFLRGIRTGGIQEVQEESDILPD